MVAATLQSHGVAVPVSTEAARILVVEDNRDTSVCCASCSGARATRSSPRPPAKPALATLERTPDVDLIVLDLMLPGMSGYEVIERHARHDPRSPTTPILVLSALSSPSARIRGLRDGADDYMTKPFLPEELVARTRTPGDGAAARRRTAEIQALEKIAEAALTASEPEALLDKMVEVVVARVRRGRRRHPPVRRSARRSCAGAPPRASSATSAGWPCRPAAGVAAIALSTLAPVLIRTTPPPTARGQPGHPRRRLPRR